MSRWLFGLLGLVGMTAAAAGSWMLVPLPAGLTDRDARPAVEITDRHGLPLRTARAADGTLTRWVPLAEMDPDLIAAFLAMEDGRFHSHGGVDLRAVARATRTNLAAGRVVSGASTITNTWPSSCSGGASAICTWSSLPRHSSPGAPRCRPWCMCVCGSMV